MRLLADCVARQGYASTEDKRQILRLPLGISSDSIHVQCGEAKQYRLLVTCFGRR